MEKSNSMGTAFYMLGSINKLRLAHKALMHPKMRDIYRVLNKGELCVTDIYCHKEIRMSQSVCSQYLRKMRDSGLLNSRRLSSDGKKIIYSINEPFREIIFNSIESIS